jgi:hypothetical protein
MSGVRLAIIQPETLQLMMGIDLSPMPLRVMPFPPLLLVLLVHWLALSSLDLNLLLMYSYHCSMC